MAPSNHDRMLAHGQALFLDYDQLTMIERFHLKADSAYLYIPFLGELHRICRATGLIERLNPSGELLGSAPFCSAMAIYDLLCRAKPYARPAGRFARIGSLASVGRASNPDDTLFQDCGALFETSLSAFRDACKKLGGEAVSPGDAAYQINTFDFLPYQLRLWFSDEEFPADLQILCDENTLDFVCFETSFYIASQLLTRVKELFHASLNDSDH